MLFKFKILCSIFLISNCLKMNTNNFCMRQTKEQKCAYDFAYKCENKFCTVNQQTCKSFKEFRLQSNKFKTLIISQIQTKQNKTFLRNIQKCTFIDYKFNSSDLCFNIDGCHYKKRIPLKTGGSFLFKYTKCKCESRAFYKYNFGRNLCAVNKYACLEREIKNMSSFKMCKYINNQ